MRTWLNKETMKWQSEKPDNYWTGVYDVHGRMIFSEDFIQYTPRSYIDRESEPEPRITKITKLFPYYPLDQWTVNWKHVIVID